MLKEDFFLDFALHSLRYKCLPAPMPFQTTILLTRCSFLHTQLAKLSHIFCVNIPGCIDDREDRRILLLLCLNRERKAAPSCPF